MEALQKLFNGKSLTYEELTQALGTKKLLLQEKDGDYVTRERLNEINQEKKELQTKLDEAAGKVTKLEADLSNFQSSDDNKRKTTEQKINDLTNQITQLTEKLTSSSEQLKQEKVSNALRSHLTDAKANPKYLKILTKEFDLSKLEVTEDNKIKGFDDLVKPVIEQYPDFFGEVKFVGNQPGNGNNPGASVEMSSDDFYSQEVFNKK